MNSTKSNFVDLSTIDDEIPPLITTPIPTLARPVLKRSKTISTTRTTNNNVVESTPPRSEIEEIEEEDPPKENFQAKSYVFTLSCGAYADSVCGPIDQKTQVVVSLRAFQKLAQECEYAIAGTERYKDSGLLHLQGFIHLKKKQRLNKLKPFFNGIAHWEPKSDKSKISQASDYCKKEGDFVEFGTRPPDDIGEIQVNRWAIARQSAENGDFGRIDDQIYLAHFRNIVAIRARATQDVHVLPEPSGLWLHGVPGSGKSRKARSLTSTTYLKGANKWWDGYEDQETVVIEDLDKSHSWMANLIKCWTDVYPFSAEVKGGVIQIRPKNIVITSNYSIEEIFGENPVDVLAIKRRCKREFFPFAYGSTPTEVELTSFITPMRQPTFNVPETQPDEQVQEVTMEL